jgi:hypothetical protein
MHFRRSSWTIPKRNARADLVYCPRPARSLPRPELSTASGRHPPEGPTPRDLAIGPEDHLVKWAYLAVIAGVSSDTTELSVNQARVTSVGYGRRGLALRALVVPRAGGAAGHARLPVPLPSTGSTVSDRVRS